MSKFVNGLDIDKIKNKKGLEKLYDNLINYNNDLRCQTALFFDNKAYNVDIDFTRNDCCVNSWTYNFYFRTNKAILGERYKTFRHMIKALKSLCKKHNTEINQLRFYKGLYNTHIFTLNI